MTDPAARPSVMARVLNEALEFAKALLILAPFYLIFTTVVYAQYVIPSESMVPTLEVGDRVGVSKFSYGYSRHSLPLNIGFLLPPAEHRFLEHLPARGDVVVFINPHNGMTLIKRLIGLPGDEIAMRDGRLFINGDEAPVTLGEPGVRRAEHVGLESFTEREETLPGGVRHVIHEFAIDNPLDNFGPVRVPDGHVFFMGDNRDNSLDSRWPGLGFVPIDNLIGRAETVIFAAPRCRGESCPERQRWLRPLHD